MNICQGGVHVHTLKNWFYTEISMTQEIPIDWEQTIWITWCVLTSITFGTIAGITIGIISRL